MSREFDSLLQNIADYVIAPGEFSELAYLTARHALLDSIGCAMQALDYLACTRHLGPVVPETKVPNGVKVFGTDYYLDPIQAAFNIGTMIRWLDYNDTWLAKEWGHPSDNLGAILAIAAFTRKHTIQDVLTAMIKAYEIQGILALDNSFNAIGIDHVVLVKVASSAVVTQMLGGDRNAILNALSQAFVDGQSLRTYRHAPNTGSRKSWAAGDATSRAVRLAMMSLKGEMGYPSVLTAPTWGFQDVLFKGQSITLSQPLQCYVMENILFKIAAPAEFHSQTAVEAAMQLHPEIINKIDKIEKIHISTHNAAMRIINKTGPLHNPADRDHCMQYMVAVSLLTGDLRAEHYEDSFAANVQIDKLRDCMVLTENEQFSKDYLDPDKRAISNTVQIHFSDGSKTDAITIEYPLGHKRRREEGIEKLMLKYQANMQKRFNPEAFDTLNQQLSDDTTRIADLSW